MTGDEGLKGSVTVYLALIFTIIFSLIMVSLEAARSAASRAYARMLLSAAAESAMADYFRPLFDRYHLFALDTGYGRRFSDIETLKANIEAGFADNPFRLEETYCNIRQTSSYLGNDGTVFIDQAVDYEELAVAADALEALGDKLGILAGQSEGSVILERKTAIEESLAEIDKRTIGLMKTVDGIEIDVDALLEGEKGYIVGGSFVKRFFTSEVSMAATGINNPEMYEEIKDLYRNPRKMAEKGAGTARELADTLEKITLLEEEIKQYQQELTELEERIAMLESEDAGLPEAERKNAGQLEDLYGERAGTSAELLSASQQYVAAKSSAEMLTVSFGLTSVNLSELCSSTEASLIAAIAEVDAITGIQISMQPEVQSFEAAISGNEGTGQYGYAVDYSDSLDKMKVYTGIESSSELPDFAAIKSTLEYDYNLLRGSNASERAQAPEELSPDNLRLWADDADGLAAVFESFSYSGLQFDYSSFRPGEEEAVTGTAAGSILSLLSESFTELILPEGVQISDGIIVRTLAPKFVDEEPLKLSIDDVSGLIGDTDSESGAGQKAAADDMSALGRIAAVLKNGLGGIYRKAMLTMYEGDHFIHYRTENDPQDTILKYEQEFILCGHATDPANLSGAFLEIMLLRLVSTSLYAFTCKSLTSQALAIAEALIGFTGLQFLVILLKYTILFLWAVEQAIVETAAVVRGKEVPVITGEKSACISLAELGKFSGSLVDIKADGFCEGGPALKYEDYLFALMLLKDDKVAAERSLTLIQENLRYGYNDNFLFYNCIYGISTEAGFSCPAVYTRLFGGTDGPAGYEFTVRSEQAY